MISHLSHATVYVTDHDEALAFYRDALGFAVRTDQTMGDFRWVTVAPKGQDDLELVLMLLEPSPHMDAETVATMKELLGRGAFGTGVFAVDDCRATYDELTERGVRFVQEPQEQPYGVEAVLTDPFGNWFSVTQRTD